MKIMLALLLLVTLAGCASSDVGQQTTPQIKYGGTMETQIGSNHGIYAR